MSLDTLLLVLVLAIVSNVLLVVAAIRSGAFGDRDGDRDLAKPVEGSARLTVRTERPRASGRDGIADPGAAAPIPLVNRAVPPGPVRPAAASQPVAAPATPEPVALADTPADAPVPAPVPAPASVEPVPSPAPPAPAATRPGRRGGRSRFVLPSIDVDHARTERVVLSLLSGDDRKPEPPGPEIVDAWERLVGPADADGADRSGTVVALTLEGIERLAESGGREPAERLVTATLDALRRSARASDRVASIGRGHFRVLLVDADEVVAARFVTRVRGSVERRLAMAAAPVTVAAGWSEAASAGELEVAVRQAEEHRRADAAPRRRRRSGGGAPA